MAPKIFVTGVTGYIGGDTLYALYTTHIEFTYTALVRTQDKGNKIKKAYPNINIILGDLDKSKALEEEIAKADVVIYTADVLDHEGAARAIAKGLASRHSNENPGFWLHTFGTLTNLPNDVFQRNVNNIVLEAGKKDSKKVKTAIVYPPAIYGFIHLSKEFISIIGANKVCWSHAHVADLADVFVLLAEPAVAKGHFFMENGEHAKAKRARRFLGWKPHKSSMGG
ncbi:NAD(P)-binding protein [Lojkania enalia]|uniref:NAD(P)-binding protein n=1 Tax=Lojkania enalia TaxID=147567 RepID=A0A9P4N3L9_9PLEO|nr:NAD(P)-binding protein [Didymosphaeria enalia]